MKFKRLILMSTLLISVLISKNCFSEDKFTYYETTTGKQKASRVLYQANNENIGIGENSPDATLEIVESGATPFMISNGASGDGDFVIVTTAGNVGIGSAVPIYNLDVNGDIGINTYLHHNADPDTYLKFNAPDAYLEKIGNVVFTNMVENDTQDYIQMGHSGDVDVRLGPSDALFVEGSSGNVGIGTIAPIATLEIIESGTTPFMLSNGAGGAGDFVTVTTAGNVGIGTAVPVASLHVNGTAEFVDIVSFTPIPTTHYMKIDTYTDDGIHFAVNPGNTTANHNFVFTTLANLEKDHDLSSPSDHPTIHFFSDTNVDDQNTERGSLSYEGDAAGSGYANFATAAGDIVLQPAGNVGIGTNAPIATLEIIESGVVPFMISNGVGGAGDFFIIDTGGQVGIGTTVPTAQFQLHQTADSWSEGLEMLNAAGQSWEMVIDSNNDLFFGYEDSAKIKFFDNGDLYVINNVGIGDETPETELDVVGTVNAQAYTIDDKFVVCDTFTSAGINACIDALGAEGGEVYLPESDYDIIASITIDYDNTTLRGAGKGTRLLATNRFVYDDVTGTPAVGETLDGDTNNYTATVVQVDTTNKIVWYHSLSNAANYNDDEVISWSGGADTTVDGTPTEQNFHAIDINGKSYAILSDFCIWGGSGGGNGNDLVGDGADDDNVEIKNLWVFESDRYGINTAGEDAKILFNHCNGVESRGISYTGDYGLIEGNDASECQIGIYINSASYIKVISNHSQANATDGIQLSSVNHCTLTGNTVFNNGTDAIELVSTTYCSVTGNTIYDTNTGYADIKLNNADYTTVGKNTCNGLTDSDKGIWLDESDYCVIEGNITNGHDVAGIQEDSDCQNNIIYGNNCQDTTRTVINGTLHEKLDEKITLADESGLYVLRAKAGWGHIYSSDDASYAYFTFTSAGAVTLVSQNNCTTTADNDGTLNIYDSGSEATIENELGGPYDFAIDIHYID